MCPGIQSLGVLSVPACANGWGQPASCVVCQSLAVRLGPTTAAVIAGWKNHFLLVLQPHHRDQPYPLACFPLPLTAPWSSPKNLPFPHPQISFRSLPGPSLHLISLHWMINPGFLLGHCSASFFSFLFFFNYHLYFLYISCQIVQSGPLRCQHLVVNCKCGYSSKTMSSKSQGPCFARIIHLFKSYHVLSLISLLKYIFQHVKLSYLR